MASYSRPGRPFLSVAAGAARADEIRLKDGTKIIGTIVGFENDSFRVETSFGFALIQKDKVADINITATEKRIRRETQGSRARVVPGRRDAERSPSGSEGAHSLSPPEGIALRADAAPRARSGASANAAKNRDRCAENKERGSCAQLPPRLPRRHRLPRRS